MNTFINELKNSLNFTETENGALTHKTTQKAVLDLFAMGAAYRSRSDEDALLLFNKAFREDPLLALKCLFYIRDCRGGQGERRFFKVCLKWLAKNYPSIVLKNIYIIPYYGRWDDLFELFDTFCEKDMIDVISNRLQMDLFASDQNLSLCAKWMPSENSSSKETKKLAKRFIKAFDFSSKRYRQILSRLRKRINIVESKMSQNHWDEIEFDKLPSVAGIRYSEAFARNPITAQRYKEFFESKNAKVNASTLYPYDIAHKVLKWGYSIYSKFDEGVREMIQTYWDNLPDYYQGREENGISIVDVSGSMYGRPLEAAISLGAYVASKSHGLFSNYFITFSDEPELVAFEGEDIVDKFTNMAKSNWGYNTNIEKVFDLLLTTIKKKHVKKEDIPDKLYIFSDMEFDQGLKISTEEGVETLLEKIEEKWDKTGYKLPKVIFWNLDARHDNIPALGNKFSYVSGLSPVIIKTILSGKDGWDLCLEVLNSDRYKNIII